MQLQLLQGQFSAREALNILSEMIQVKIRFHEAKIEASDREEDIHMRERRISELQNEMHRLRHAFKSNEDMVTLEAAVNLQ
jgi:argininosuccinate lyase